MGGGGPRPLILNVFPLEILQPFSAHLEYCREQILLQISHTHCVGPAYASLWSLLGFTQIFQVSGKGCRLVELHVVLLWSGSVQEEEEVEDLEGDDDQAQEVSGEEDKRTKVKMRPATVRRLIRRRVKPEGGAHRRNVSFKELLKLNRPDWPLVLVGVILSSFIGCLFPLMAVLFGEVLRVSTYHFLHH